MYIDLLQQLVDFEAEKSERDIGGQILEAIHDIGLSSGGENGGDGSSPQGSIEQFIDTVDKLDSKKADSISALLVTFGDIKITDSVKTNSESLTSTITNLSNAVNLVDVSEEKLQQTERLISVTGQLIKTSMLIALATPALAIAAVESMDRKLSQQMTDEV